MAIKTRETTAIGVVNNNAPLSNADLDNNFVELQQEKVSKDSDTGAALLPVGTTAQQPPSPSNGMLRYNSELLSFEGYSDGVWGAIAGGGGGGSINATVATGSSLAENDTVLLNGSGEVYPVTITGASLELPAIGDLVTNADQEGTASADYQIGNYFGTAAPSLSISDGTGLFSGCQLRTDASIELLFYHGVAPVQPAMGYAATVNIAGILSSVMNYGQSTWASLGQEGAPTFEHPTDLRSIVVYPSIESTTLNMRIAVLERFSNGSVNFTLPLSDIEHTGSIRNTSNIIYASEMSLDGNLIVTAYLDASNKVSVSLSYKSGDSYVAGNTILVEDVASLPNFMKVVATTDNTFMLIYGDSGAFSSGYSVAKLSVTSNTISSTFLNTGLFAFRYVGSVIAIPGNANLCLFWTYTSGASFTNYLEVYDTVTGMSLFSSDSSGLFSGDVKPSTTSYKICHVDTTYDAATSTIGMTIPYIEDGSDQPYICALKANTSSGLISSFVGPTYVYGSAFGTVGSSSIRYAQQENSSNGLIATGTLWTPSSLMLGSGATSKPISNLSGDHTYVGISTGTFAAGQEATIATGGIVDTFSGLVPNVEYYVQFDGSLASTDAGTNIIAGRALNATTLWLNSDIGTGLSTGKYPYNKPAGTFQQTVDFTVSSFNLNGGTSPDFGLTVISQDFADFLNDYEKHAGLKIILTTDTGTYPAGVIDFDLPANIVVSQSITIYMSGTSGVEGVTVSSLVIGGSANYIDGATSLVAADLKLDEALANAVTTYGVDQLNLTASTAIKANSIVLRDDTGQAIAPDSWLLPDNLNETRYETALSTSYSVGASLVMRKRTNDEITSASYPVLFGANQATNLEVRILSTDGNFHTETASGNISSVIVNPGVGADYTYANTPIMPEFFNVPNTNTFLGSAYGGNSLRVYGANITAASVTSPELTGISSFYSGSVGQKATCLDSYNSLITIAYRSTLSSGAIRLAKFYQGHFGDDVELSPQQVAHSSMFAMGAAPCEHVENSANVAVATVFTYTDSSSSYVKAGIAGSASKSSTMQSATSITLFPSLASSYQSDIRRIPDDILNVKGSVNEYYLAFSTNQATIEFRVVKTTVDDFPLGVAAASNVVRLDLDTFTLFNRNRLTFVETLAEGSSWRFVVWSFQGTGFKHVDLIVNYDKESQLLAVYFKPYYDTSTSFGSSVECMSDPIVQITTNGYPKLLYPVAQYTTGVSIYTVNLNKIENDINIDNFVGLAKDNFASGSSVAVYKPSEQLKGGSWPITSNKNYYVTKYGGIASGENAAGISSIGMADALGNIKYSGELLQPDSIIEPSSWNLLTTIASSGSWTPDAYIDMIVKDENLNLVSVTGDSYKLEFDRQLVADAGGQFYGIKAKSPIYVPAKGGISLKLTSSPPSSFNLLKPVRGSLYVYSSSEGNEFRRIRYQDDIVLKSKFEGDGSRLRGVAANVNPGSFVENIYEGEGIVILDYSWYLDGLSFVSGNYIGLNPDGTYSAETSLTSATQEFDFGKYFYANDGAPSRQYVLDVEISASFSRSSGAVRKLRYAYVGNMIYSDQAPANDGTLTFDEIGLGSDGAIALTYVSPNRYKLTIGTTSAINYMTGVVNAKITLTANGSSQFAGEG